MKSTRTLTVLAFALFAAFAINAFAADPQPGTNTTSPTFIDENGDGVCDNYAANGGKGLGLGKGERRNFVDADGDGVCDNTGSGTKNQRKFGNKNQLKTNFVDADGDGVCDNVGTGKSTRNRTVNGNGGNSLKK